MSAERGASAPPSPDDGRLAAFATYLRRRLADAGMAPLALVPGSPGTSVPADEVPPGSEVVLVAGTPSPGRLEGLAAATGLSCSLAGPGLALLDRFDPASVGPAPDGFDVLAVVTTFNESDIVEGLVSRLASDGIRVHVVDNWSSDGTGEIVAALVASGACTSERFPLAGPSPRFELEALLRRVEEIAASSGADWVVHHDADEVREPPWPGVSLRSGLFAVDSFGFNCVDHTVANFVPVDDSFVAGADLLGSFEWFSFGESAGHFLQQKAWKPQPGGVEMASSGGHEVRFAGRRVFPYKFLLRHYPVRSQAHGERKVFRERRGRFSPAERARGWHVHYDSLPEGASFLGDPSTLSSSRELDRALLLERLSGAGLPGNPFPGEGPPAPGETAGDTHVGPAPPVGGGAPHGAHLLRIQSVLHCPPEGGVERWARATGQAVRALLAARPGDSVEIALADNSPDATFDEGALERLRWSFTGTGLRALHYAHFPDNPGHGGAQNRLLAADTSGADLVLLSNPDTCSSPGMLVELLAPLAGPVGVVEARQLPLEHQKSYDLATGDTSWASGACSLYRREVLEATGGFDSGSFFLYCDDVDLSWRARLAGFRVVHAPAAVCFHDKRLSADASEQPSRAEVYHSGLARLILLTKYSRADLVGPQLDAHRGHPDAVHQEIASEFDRRRDAGLLPSPVDPDHLVADFSTYSYAPLRYDYAR
ncbi:MAG: glycosyltransferase [Actinomycetota bacterium]|nr:glycosyltransferase [Actinomycetota bacterium]